MALPATVLRLDGAVPTAYGSARSSAAAGLLLGGLSLAVFGQGAYYTRAQLLVASFVMLAVVVAPPVRPLRTLDAGRDRLAVAGAAALALSGWAALRGLAEPVPWSGLRMAAMVSGLVAVATVVLRIDSPARAMLGRGLTWISVLVSLSGWTGVVWHRAPLAMTNDGVWRATSTLTYANATAAVLGAAMLAFAGRTCRTAQRWPSTAVLTVLVVGLGATMSRAGLLALVAGVIVLAGLLGPRRVLSTLAAPAVGAAVALAGLLPSMPVTSAPGRPLAVLSLVLGAALACLLPPVIGHLRRPVRPAAVAVAGMLLAGSAVALAGPLHAPLAEVAAWRGTVGSPARVDAGRAALDLAADHPWLGVGPGAGWTTWHGPDGSRATMRYVHDEYLQVLVDVGIPGLLLLVTVLVGVGRALAPTARLSGGTAGALAAAAASAVHAGFDFVWHVPAVPLLVAALVALGSPPDRTTPAAAGADQEGVVA